MDEFDRASEFEQRDRELSLSIRKKTLQTCGFCHNCGAPCRGCFCDHECADDYEVREKAKERNGR